MGSSNNKIDSPEQNQSNFQQNSHQQNFHNNEPKIPAMGCFCISNGSVDRTSEMRMNEPQIHILGRNPTEIIEQDKKSRGLHRQARNTNSANGGSGKGVMVVPSTSQKQHQSKNEGNAVRPFKNITNQVSNNANTDTLTYGQLLKKDENKYSSSVDLQRVQQLFQIVKNGRILVNDFDGDQENITRKSDNLMSVSSMNKSYRGQSYPTLLLQFKLPGQHEVIDLIMNPQGIMHPQTIKNGSRRANDGHLYFGQNKFDEKGIQVNDFCLEFNLLQNDPKGILKDKKNTNNLGVGAQCPERLRGQHCKIFYDIKTNTYKIKDQSIGVGSFLRCDNRNQFSQNFDPMQSTQLHDDCIIQLGASLYGLVNIITIKRYQKFMKNAEQGNNVPQDTPPQHCNNPLMDKINERQQVLRIKFFGGQLYGQVRYFVPQWDSNQIMSSSDGSNNKVLFDMLQKNDTQLENMIQNIQNILPYRFYTVGRKQKQSQQQMNSAMHKVHDIEIPKDNTISSNQCYFVYNPINKSWYLNDGKLETQSINNQMTMNADYTVRTSDRKSNSSNGTWLFLDKERAIESGQRFRLNGTHILAKII